jgi:hypothetical protein
MNQVTRFILLCSSIALPLLAGCGPAKGTAPGEKGATALSPPTVGEAARPKDVKGKTQTPASTSPAGPPAKPGGLPPGRGGPG